MTDNSKTLQLSPKLPRLIHGTTGKKEKHVFWGYLSLQGTVFLVLHLKYYQPLYDINIFDDLQPIYPL